MAGWRTGWLGVELGELCGWMENLVVGCKTGRTGWLGVELGGKLGGMGNWVENWVHG